MYLGVDYYPEYWPVAHIDEDLDGIVKLGANSVRIGEFSWHLMEKTEGKYDFSFYDNLLSKLDERQLKVMFGTPTATFPAWLAKKHPSILGKERDGQVRSFGGRRQYCYNSTIYVQYASHITTRLVQHFADNDTIISWQIDNEFGHEGSDQCYCEQCHLAFQRYLLEKYKQNIDLLNETYGSIFWGQTYNSFDEIPMPTHTITEHNPALQLDWAKFRSYSVNQFAYRMVKIVEEAKGAHQTITHNFPGGFFDNKWYDYAEHAEMLDYVSYDNYPVWGGLEQPISPSEIALGLDFMRGLKNKNFWIVEQLIGAQGHNIIGFLPRPNQAKMWSYQAFAHGCNNMLYFNWKAMTRGAEQFCMGIIDHDNERGQKFNEVKQFFKEINHLSNVIESEIQAEVAVLYDFSNMWSWRIQPQSKQFNFKQHLLSLYEPFYKKNITVDVVPFSRPLERYKVIVLPAQQIMTEHDAQKLEQYVLHGGILVLGYRAGLRDEFNNIHYGQLFPAYLSKLAGVIVRGVEALSEYDNTQIKSTLNKNSYSCSVWRDLLEPTTAQSLYVYDDALYPYAALTYNEFGKGKVYYIGGQFESSVNDHIVELICRQSQIKTIDSAKDVEVVTRKLDEEIYYFVMNHSSETKYFRNIELKAFETKVVLENQL